MPYVVMIHATFADKANADHVYDQAMTVATNASVARVGEPGERTSHGGVYEEMPDGTLAPDRRFHVDRFGIVRPGQLLPGDQIPTWVQPQGAQDAYPLDDVYGLVTTVMHNGEAWQNTLAANTSEPGVFGWVNLTEPVEEGGYAPWQPWTSGLNGDLYQVGDRVTHNGADWEATTGNNYWTPGEFGWVQL